ncbi:MAG: serine/threonine protein kinase [Sandaracinus sp.]|nr:serine/threonine protein kinase [Sandaracinus sp.]
MAERLPRAFGDYVLERRLGVGGMAETFVARRGATRQRVCVKRVLPAFCRDAEFVRQFEREAQLAGQLRHSNVVGVVDFGASRRRALPGARAGGRRRPSRAPAGTTGSPPPRNVAALVALDLAYALDYAHTEQVVHRDVTPSNVLLSVRGEVKLADFGVAKGLTGQTLPTASRLLKGKVPYMAPEQMSGARSTVA